MSVCVCARYRTIIISCIVEITYYGNLACRMIFCDVHVPGMVYIIAEPERVINYKSSFLTGIL